MQLPTHFSLHVSRFLAIAVALVAAAGLTLRTLLRGRKKKSDQELERERRLSVNAIGRMTDGSLLEAVNSRADPESALLVFYRYFVSGVEYSAAQDVSDLRGSIYPDMYLPGETVTIKYDQQNPSNSIVACELWSGLHAERKPIGRRSKRVTRDK